MTNLPSDQTIAVQPAASTSATSWSGFRLGRLWQPSSRMVTVDRGPIQAPRLWLFCAAFLACLAGVRAQSDIILTSGVPYNGGSPVGLVGDGSSQSFFRIVVPAGQVKLIVQTSGGDGDVDLYLRRGARPTTGVYDAASAGPTTVESVTITNPAADTYYIMLQGYGAGYLGVTLTATYQVVPPPTWTWAKSTAGGDYLNVRDTCGIARDSAGNVYFTGYFGDTINFGANRLISGSGFLPVQSGFLAKYDANGQAVWALMNVGTQGWAVTVGPDDSVYVAGEYSGTVSFSATVRLTSVAANDAFVAKYSSAGALVWVKGLAGSAASSAYSIAINAKTGNLVVGGYDTRALARVPSGGQVVRINRLNNDGTLTSTTTMIGADLSYASGVALDDSDAVYLTGSFKESLTLPNATKLTSASDQNGIPDLGGFVVKLAKDNSVTWAQTITTSGVDNYLDGLVLGNSGTVFVAGTTSRAGAGGIGLLTGYGPTGTKSFSLTASSYADDYVSPLTTDGRGGVCWGGIFSNTLTLGTVSLSSPSGTSLYVANVDASGTTKWAIAAGGYNSNTVVKGIAAGPNGDVEITGTYGGGCTFGSTNLSTSGYRELFVARFDAIVGPAIVTPPSTQSAAIGQNVTFSVTASGSGLSYQWQKNGTNIPGATNSTLVLSNVQIADAGNYAVVITNGGGSAVSPAATLSVSAAVSRLANISVRAPAGTGDQTLILGFYVGGSGSKQVLLRGVGPTLAQFGVGGVLADPQLKLFNVAGTQVDQNNDWGGSTVLATAFASVNDFALPANSKDAALLETLPTNGYTAQVSGAGTSTGVALIEAYEADTGAPSARFTALSARNQVGTGDQTLIAGFVIVGNASKKLVVRGVGPTLAQFGVAGVLADPQLKLFDSTGQQIQENNDWGGGATLSNAFTAVGAFALPANSKDAALLVTLQPGVYTAQVSGVGGTTGVALVEVYEVP